MTYRDPTTKPHPSDVVVAGFGSPSQPRRVSWPCGGLSDPPGLPNDETVLHIAPDENGNLQWWRTVNEWSVNAPGLPEKIALEEALGAVEPVYWPVLCTWTLEALREAGVELETDDWTERLPDDPDAEVRLMQLLVALVPGWHESAPPTGATRSAVEGAMRKLVPFDEDAMRARADEFRNIYGYPSDDELLERLKGLIDDGTRMSLANGARGPVYDVARSHDLITDVEYRAARLGIGDLWSYAGD